MYCYGKAGAGIDGSSAPDTASEFCEWWWDTGAGVDGSSAPDTASGIDVLSELYWGRCWQKQCSQYRQ